MIVWPAIVLAGTVVSAATSDDYDRLPSYTAGPYEVQVVESFSVHDPVQERDIVLRVLYPDGSGPFPLVVFSSGMFCYPQMYDRITSHWASHGYIVILPNHLDSPNTGKIKPEYLARLLSSRIRDMSLVLDTLDDIEHGLDLTGQVDREHVAVAGHSFGGMIAMIKTGLYLQDGQYIYTGPTADERFAAAVIMSGVGPMQQMTEDAFDGLTRPLIASGGTLDEGNVGTGEIFPWQWRLSGFTLAPDGDKYFVALDDADHYLGGLICREGRGGEADPEGVAINRALSTAFLGAYLKSDIDAKTFLQTADVSKLTGGRAKFDRK